MTINGVTEEDAVSFDGVDVFQFDDSGPVGLVRAFWQRGSLHRQFQRLREKEACEYTDEPSDADLRK